MADRKPDYWLTPGEDADSPDARISSQEGLSPAARNRFFQGLAGALSVIVYYVARGGLIQDKETATELLWVLSGQFPWSLVLPTNMLHFLDMPEPRWIYAVGLQWAIAVVFFGLFLLVALHLRGDERARLARGYAEAGIPAARTMAGILAARGVLALLTLLLAPLWNLLMVGGRLAPTLGMPGHFLMVLGNVAAVAVMFLALRLFFQELLAFMRARREAGPGATRRRPQTGTGRGGSGSGSGSGLMRRRGGRGSSWRHPSPPRPPGRAGPIRDPCCWSPRRPWSIARAGCCSPGGPRTRPWAGCGSFPAARSSPARPPRPP